MLEIIAPVTLIFRAIDMGVDAITVRFIVLPLAIEDIPINMPELAFAMSFIILPFAFIASAIRPHLDTATVPHVTSPLPVIYCTILKPVLLSILKG